MAINKGDIPFIGNRGGLCGYWRSGINIVRASSSLTGARVKKDPAFKGFRQSSNRMKEASPIAAALYSQIPKEKRNYDLYRLLTGEALKMLKEGMDKTDITERLKKLYIDPLLGKSEKCLKPSVKTRSNSKTTFNHFLTIHIPKGPCRDNISSRTESYQCRIKSRSSPVYIGLDLDLVAYG